MCVELNLQIFSIILILSLVETRHSRPHFRFAKQAGSDPSFFTTRKPPGRSSPTSLPPTPFPTRKTTRVPKTTPKSGGFGINVVDFDAPIDAPVPPGIETPPELNKWTFLGWGEGKYWWLSKFEVNRDDAGAECNALADYFAEIGADKWATETHYYLPVFEDAGERQAVDTLLSPLGTPAAWLAPILQRSGTPGARYMIRSPGGIKYVDEQTMNQRMKRMQPGLNALVTSSDDFVRKKRQNSDGASLTGQITIKETHYPWLPDWQQEGGNGCKDVGACEPVKCTVTTSPCTVQIPVCNLNSPVATCEVIPSGKCTAICESCEITRPPDCWMADNKCVVEQDRHCEMTEPECTVTTPACTITRPPCVTKPAPCNITTLPPPPECQTPAVCGTANGVTCTLVPRPCTVAEQALGITKCTRQMCTANPLCLTPDYCREGNGTVNTLTCPPPTTFCPPEIVKCPPPDVSCSEPKLNCTDPVITCPPPQLICTQPQVTCTTPHISCPTVLTSCKNPNFTCSPPDVYCEEPKLECTVPKPCFLPNPGHKPTCNVYCDDPAICKCTFVRMESPTHYVAANEDCDKEYPLLCVGNEMIGSSGTGGTKRPTGSSISSVTFPSHLHAQ